MSENHRPHQPLPFIRELCAHLSDEEIEAAEASFWRYVDIVRGIHERIEREERLGE